MKLQTSNGKSAVNKGNRELVDSNVFLQPWFLPRDVYAQIRRVLPSAHLSKCVITSKTMAVSGAEFAILSMAVMDFVRNVAF